MTSSLKLFCMQPVCLVITGEPYIFDNLLLLALLPFLLHGSQINALRQTVLHVQFQYGTDLVAGICQASRTRAGQSCNTAI